MIQEDPTCQAATKPVHHNCWACALEPGSFNYWVLRSAYPRAPAPQQEKPPQWEAHTLQLESSPHSPQLEKTHEAMKTQNSQNK